MADNRNTEIKYPQVNTLAEYVALIQDIADVKEDHHDTLLWYRGQENSEWPLWPNLYRIVDSNYQAYGGLSANLDKLHSFQNRELSNFYARRSHLVTKHQPAIGIPFPITKRKKVLSLSIIQHYFGRTCLLDWSHQAIPGAFFAIEKYFNDPSFTDENLPCVWILKPHRLNKKFRAKCKSYFENIEFNGDIRLPTFYDIKEKNENEYIGFPCAIIPPMYNDRILAQAGTFVSFPVMDKDDNKQPLDTFSFSNEILTCIILRNPRNVANDLIAMGYDSTDFYPDLTNEIRVLDQKW